MAGDTLRMEYYGDINEVVMESDNESTYILDGELKSIEYKKANVEKVTYSKKYSDEKNRFTFVVDGYDFDYILIDKVKFPFQNCMHVLLAEKKKICDVLHT